MTGPSDLVKMDHHDVLIHQVVSPPTTSFFGKNVDRLMIFRDPITKTYALRIEINHVSVLLLWGFNANHEVSAAWRELLKRVIRGVTNDSLMEKNQYTE